MLSLIDARLGLWVANFYQDVLNRVNNSIYQESALDNHCDPGVCDQGQSHFFLKQKLNPFLLYNVVCFLSIDALVCGLILSTGSLGLLPSCLVKVNITVVKNEDQFLEFSLADWCLTWFVCSLYQETAGDSYPGVKASFAKKYTFNFPFNI